MLKKITSHLPPYPTTLKTGLSCHHSFNDDKRYYVSSSIEKDIDRLIEDLDKAFAKYRGRGTGSPSHDKARQSSGEFSQM